MSGHTPGPWTARPDPDSSVEWEVVSADGWYIAEVMDGAGEASSETNARLIAAAPQLLAALKDIRDTTSDLWIVDKAEAAIRAAEGETP